MPGIADYNVTGVELAACMILSSARLHDVCYLFLTQAQSLSI